MQIIKSAVFAFIIVTGACASTPGGRGSREVAKEPLRGGAAEFRLTSYDGRVLAGRVLIGTTVDPLVIDGRLYEWADVELKDLRECGKKDLLKKHMVYEALPQPPRAEEIITIRRGYWYGTDVSYVLFNEELTGWGPACLEAELVVRAADWRVAAKLPIRAVRTDKSPAAPDGGASEPKPPASDAGAP